MTSDSLIGKLVRFRSLDDPFCLYNNTFGEVIDFRPQFDAPDPMPHLVKFDDGEAWWCRDSELEPIEEERHDRFGGQAGED